jgi:hypothetical protein
MRGLRRRVLIPAAQRRPAGSRRRAFAPGMNIAGQRPRLTGAFSLKTRGELRASVAGLFARQNGWQRYLQDVRNTRQDGRH